MKSYYYNYFDTTYYPTNLFIFDRISALSCFQLKDNVENIDKILHGAFISYPKHGNLSVPVGSSINNVTLI